MSSLRELSDRLRASSPYQRWNAEGGVASGLPLAAAAWVVGCLAEQRRCPIMVVVPREGMALEWVEASRCFGGSSTLFFPAPSLTPYQQAEVPLAVRATEVVALDRLYGEDPQTLICTPRALFRRLPPREAFHDAVVHIVPGDEWPMDELADHLLDHGYRRVDLVGEVGEFAVRGGLFDVFPPGYDDPFRLDFFGDEIESIRDFDVATQRSSEQRSEVAILPLDLYPCGPEQASRLAEVLADDLEVVGGLDLQKRVEALETGELFSGWQNLLPMLWPDSISLLEGGERPLLILVEPEVIRREVDHFEAQLDNQYRHRIDVEEMAIPPQRLVFAGDQVRGWLDAAPMSVVDFFVDDPSVVNFGATRTDAFQGQLGRFPREIETARARHEEVLLIAPQDHHDRVREALGAHEVSFEAAGVQLIAGELQRGFRLPEIGAVLYSDQQLFPRVLSGSRKRSRASAFFSGMRDLRAGDFVVHEEHGIGRLLGLRTLGSTTENRLEIPRNAEEAAAAASRSEVEVLEIAYANGKTLLLPPNRLDLIEKYQGLEGVSPRLDTLGGTSWRKTRSRVKRSVRDMAEELLKLYAQRELATAPAMLPDSDQQSQFEASFDFDETDDQLTATAAIKGDLESNRPMDRLLCGDVGFGKTEVALRAAFKAVDSGYQVAVLAPTTILADQHLETFRRRLRDFPVTVEMISRFRTAKQVKQILVELEAGKIDILVGTHRLLSSKVKFPRLGLLIVDEEQRFGVAQKERLKQFRKDVHVLAMSATPVPRTLQLSVAGVRDLSLIESPPKDRMAIETRILPFSDDLIREAIEFEIERGGQVYFVHNRVSTIDRLATHLSELVPGLRVTVGHGQMDELELATRMHAFTAGEYDLLVASTIIENGIDIPNVNTMLVDHSERLGLAQLYQLRGRVGRSDQLAYCYLLVPEDRVLPQDAQRRLSAIREFTDLGAGFRIAARDLEIRGAGNLLGAEQSGHITELGIETYLRMLEQTVKELKGEIIEEAPSVSIDLPVDMSIPESYIQETNLRMGVYRRFGSGDESGEALLSELADRFGRPPTSVITLAAAADLKRLAERLRVQSIAARRNELVIRLRQDSRVDVDRLIRLVSEHPEIRFSPSGVLSLPMIDSDPLGLALRTLEAVSG